jgi:hypothetical protein
LLIVDSLYAKNCDSSTLTPWLADPENTNALCTIVSSAKGTIGSFKQQFRNLVCSTESSADRLVLTLALHAQGDTLTSEQLFVEFIDCWHSTGARELTTMFNQTE